MHRSNTIHRTAHAAAFTLLVIVLLLSVSAESATLDVHNLSIVWQNDTEVMVEFYINNTGSSTLTQVNWTLGFGNGTFTDGDQSLTLAAGEDALVFARYSYAGTGADNYEVNATAYNASIVDMEYLTVRVEGPPTFDQNLTAQNATAQIEFEYQINCSDPNDDTITYSDNSSLLNIDPDTGVIDWTFGEADIGNYSIEITASDETTSTNQTFSLEVKPKKDLEVLGMDIYFDPENPIEGENVDIEQVVWNRGPATLNNVRVRFYYDNYSLIDEVNITQIPGGENRTAQTNWSSEASGIHIIRVKVDPLDEIKESVETNNEAQRGIPIGNYDIGDIIVTASVTTPVEPGESSGVSGDAEYNTTYGSGTKVAGATVTIANQDTNESWTTYTLSDGTYSKTFDAPATVGNYTITINVNDGTFSPTETRTLRVDPFPDPPSVQLTPVTISVNDSAPLVNDTLNITVSVTNVGNENATSLNVVFIGPGGTIIANNSISAMGANSSSVSTWTEWNASPVGTQYITAQVWWNGTYWTPGSAAGVRVYSDQPDLATVSVSPDDWTPAEGQTVSVTTTIKNLEGGDVDNPFKVTFRNGRYGLDWENYTNITSLSGKGGSSVLSFDWIPSSELYDDRILNIQADSENAIATEYTEDNNNLSIDVTVHAAGPDVKVHAVTFNESEPDEGHNITVTATIKNIGELNATNVTVTFEDIFNGTITFIANKTIGFTEVNDYNSTTTEWNASPGGSHTIRVTLTLATDTYTGNNIKGSTIYAVPPTGATDLQILSEDIWLSNDYPALYELVNVEATVRNIHATNNATDVLVKFSLDGTQFDTQTITSLDAMNNITLISNFTSNELGSHVVEIDVDPLNEIDETTKTNNNATRGIVVILDPDHEITSFTALKNATPLFIFETVIKNICDDTNLTDISWKFNTGESNITGLYNFSLTINKTARLFLAHNYSSTGTYYPKVYVKNQGKTVSEELNITVT